MAGLHGPTFLVAGCRSQAFLSFLREISYCLFAQLFVTTQARYPEKRRRVRRIGAKRVVLPDRSVLGVRE